MLCLLVPTPAQRTDEYPPSGCPTGGGPFAFTGLGGGTWVGVSGFMSGELCLIVHVLMSRSCALCSCCSPAILPLSILV